MAKSKLKIAAIDFLNPAPLMWNFEHEPEQSRLATRYELERMTPAQCAARLGNQSVDIGLIPVAAYAEIPGLAVIPGCAIASLGSIRSLLLIAPKKCKLESIRTVATDTSSRTTVAYTKILFRKHWNPSTVFVPHAPDLSAMLSACDGAVLIGDPALLALANPQGDLAYYDLAAEWKRATGATWISAVWAIWPEALERCGISAAEVVTDFVKSRRDGLNHVNDLVREWTMRIALPSEMIHNYLTRNIHYVLDEKCIQSLTDFYIAGAETGVLTQVPQLRWLGSDSAEL